jgi:hypothetical protein
MAAFAVSSDGKDALLEAEGASVRPETGLETP